MPDAKREGCDNDSMMSARKRQRQIEEQTGYDAIGARQLAWMTRQERFRKTFFVVQVLTKLGISNLLQTKSCVFKEFLLIRSKEAGNDTICIGFTQHA